MEQGLQASEKLLKAFKSIKRAVFVKKQVDKSKTYLCSKKNYHDEQR